MPEEMARLSWQDIVKSLETGSMKAQGSALSVDDRRAVARYLLDAGTGEVVWHTPPPKLYTTSGYSQGTPGNGLPAFSVSP